MDFFSLLDPLTLAKAGGLIGISAIIFVETGLFFGFFFPGDSLLFTAGFLASQGLLDIWLILPFFFVASVCGNMVGYAFGKKVGPKLFSKEDSVFFHKKHVEKTQHFFEHHGGRTILLARFFPIIRTFAPILAGVGGMHWKTFFIYSIAGGALWTIGLTLLGYVLGATIPDIDKYLLPIIGGIVVVSILPAAIHLLKSRMAE